MMKKYRRKAVSGVLIICMLLTFCSCSKKEKQHTLTFASWYTEEDTLAYREIAAKYHDMYPNVTVEFITLEKTNNNFIEYTENVIKAIDEDRVDLVLLHPSIMTSIYEG